ncbi:MAG: immunoglobulin domain-containing protein [Opitutaceae bacterium]
MTVTPSSAQVFVAEWTERDIDGIGPTGLAIDTVGGVSYLYAADENHGRIIKYDLATGARIAVWGTNGTGNGQFNSPYGIAVDPVSHDIYVAERGNHRVQRLTSNGTFVMAWGTLGTGAGQFDQPIGVAADAAGNVYVTDHNNSRVQKFRVQFNGTNWTAQHIGGWGSLGAGNGQFNGIYGITLDASGNLWVADGFNHRLQKFDANGGFLGVIGSFGSGNGQFITPTWVNFDSTGAYYVAETNSNPQNTAAADIQNQRIQKFTSAGVFVTKWGGYGEAGGLFRLPFNIVVGDGGFAYVSDYYNTRIQKFNLAAVALPALPSQTVAVGSSATFSLSVAGSPSYQWQRNGTNLPGATGFSFTVSNAQPVDAGIYTVVVTNGSASSSQSGVLGVTSAAKVSGAGTEVGSNIVHPNGNVYDQVLLQGAAAAVRADPGQVVRMSYIDLNDDIVQVEFAGAGTLSLVLDDASGPATPVKYNQPTVSYVRGHASIVIAGANESTNVSVFSVGRANAVNQALFRDDVIYDGLADFASVAVLSANGKFGGIRTANGSYFNTKGTTGIYAPGVEFTGPIFVGDISAAGGSTPVFLLGSSTDVRVTGGDLWQMNNRAVQVSGMTQLRFVDGITSHGAMMPAQIDQGRLEMNGVDVTNQIVINP